MKTAAIIAIVALAAVAALFYAAPFQAAPPDLAGYVPAGPLLYLEARDFAALLRDWNSSAEKRAWLDSANYEMFSRSHLFGRLQQAWNEFTAAAGFTPGMQMVESIAGGRSALALYDIGKLQFLYIAELPSARAMESRLWQSRAKYQSRNAAGSPFYVKSDAATGRVVAFAAYRDYVLLATREELVAGALRLLAGERPPAVGNDSWFRESVRAASSPGDLRLVLNLESIIRTPYFRSYWIQRNTSALQPFWAAIADVRMSPAQIREDRVLLRKQSGTPPSATVAALARLVPDDAGLYRAWAAPDVSMAADLIRDKLLAPEVSHSAWARYAPWIEPPPIAGAESDLETRTDEPPLAGTSGRFAIEPLRNLLARAGLESVLHIQTNRRLADGVFVETPSAIALMARSAWDANAVRSVLASGAENVEFRAQGNLLVLANSTNLLHAVLSRTSRQPEPNGATYVAGFRHAQERANFEKLMGALDYNQPQPALFSGSIGSLSRVLARVTTETITVHDTGASLVQTVVYETR
jgi:hypothetical protein